MDRRKLVAHLLADRSDLLVVTGLGSATYDVAACGDHPLNFYIWSAMGCTGMVGLGDFPGGSFESTAFNASADGSVIVGLGYPNISSAPFRWTQATGLVGLGHLPGQDIGVADDVSADGTVIVGQSASRGFRWTAATGMVDLGDLPGGDTYTHAVAVSTDGLVAVASGHQHRVEPFGG